MLLAKITGIIILVWFYQTAKNQGENPIKWAITGVIGYWLIWWILVKAVANPILDSTHSDSVVFLLFIRHIPMFAAIAGAALVRYKFLVKTETPDE